MKSEASKIDNIKSLYAQIEEKGKFILLVANECKRKPNTVKTHWFTEASFWSVPDEFQDRVIELAQNTIAKQNKVIA